MKIKGINRLDRVLTRFAKQFDCDVMLDTDFYCILTSNRIAYSLVVSKASSTSFMNRVQRLYPDINADEFLWSFLHEIGHIETYEDMTEEEIRETMGVKDCENITDEEYYELLDEYLATEWAANYMRENQEQIAKFWKKVRKNIMYIYRVNGLC
jgi:hypothetical protein